MRALQFWILLIVSLMVSGLMIEQIFVNRTLNKAQRELVDSQETASVAPAFEKAWKQLALAIFQASHDDPVLVQLLKRESVEVHPNSPVEGPAPATTPLPPATSSKAPVAAGHPATP